MDWLLPSLDYLLGVPILGLGEQIGFIWKALLLLVTLLVFVAYVLLADRKIWAAVQIRRGPNVVGAFGLLQSFADLAKFVFKEPVIPAGADKVVFLLAPFVTVLVALAAWAVVPIDEGWAMADINVGVLYILAISSLGVYGVIMGGWASNSKYPFLGALRSAAQMVSYEVSIGFVIITVLLCVGSLNLTDIVHAQQEMGLAHMLGVPWLSFLNWFWLPCSRCSSSFSSRPWQKQTAHHSTCRRLSLNWSLVSWWNMAPPLHDVHAGASMWPLC